MTKIQDEVKIQIEAQKKKRQIRQIKYRIEKIERINKQIDGLKLEIVKIESEIEKIEVEPFDGEFDYYHLFDGYKNVTWTTRPYIIPNINF